MSVTYVPNLSSNGHFVSEKSYAFSTRHFATCRNRPIAIFKKSKNTKYANYPLIMQIRCPNPKFLKNTGAA